MTAFKTRIVTKGTDFDLSPFFTSSAVTNRASKSFNTVSPIAIPKTLTPSPLASSIAPQQLKSIRDHFCGLLTPHTPQPHAPGDQPGLLPQAAPRVTDKIDDTEPPKYSEDERKSLKNGEEIWKSWKRAYDLWNGYYIEGRVNEAWVGKEFQRIEKEFAADETRRRPQKFVSLDGGVDEIFDNEDKPAKGIWGEKAPSAVDLGGGFFPSKSFPEFAMPVDMLPSSLTGQDTSVYGNYVENLQNVVWRPRRVGEKRGEPVIEIDGKVEDWFAKQICGNDVDERGFNGWVDGGYDCGRSPFPLLRPKTIYTRPSAGPGSAAIHTYGKRQIWDGVTGTIFNIATPSLHSSQLSRNRQLLLSQMMQGDLLRDSCAENHSRANKGVFPLDIRRCMKKLQPKTDEEMESSATTAGSSDKDKEETIELDNEFPAQPRRHTQLDDRWYVTEAQRKLRDTPTRLYPPAPQVDAEDTDFPTDFSMWEAEREKDNNRLAAYFVTNTHGGTLIINGIQIGVGQIAGPLPPFAVLECPNGEVVFWWGVGGREYGAAALGSELWYTTLNQSGEEWKFVNKPAGEVWMKKIEDRRRQLRTGESLWDDKLWKRYKEAAAKEDGDLLDAPQVGAIPSVWDGQFGHSAHSFAHDKDELKHLVLKTEVASRMAVAKAQSSNLVFPEADSFWLGPYQLITAPFTLATVQAEDFWNERQCTLIFAQKQYSKQRLAKMEKNKQILEAKTKEKTAAAVAELAKKRKLSGAVDDSSPPPKKSRQKSHKEHQDAVEKEVLFRLSIKLLNNQMDQKKRLAAVLSGKPRASLARIAKEFRQKEERHEKLAENLRVFNNKSKALNGQPEDPPPYGSFTKEQVQAFIYQHIPQALTYNERAAGRASQVQAEREYELQKSPEEEHRQKEEEATGKQSDEYQQRQRRKDWQAKQASALEVRRRLRSEKEDAAAAEKASQAARAYRIADLERKKEDNGICNPHFPRRNGSGHLSSDQGTGPWGHSRDLRLASDRRERKSNLEDSNADYDHVVAQSLREAKAMEDKDMRETLARSRVYKERKKNHLEALEARAKTVGLSSDANARQEGFTTAMEYVLDRMGERFETVERKGEGRSWKATKKVEQQFVGPLGLREFQALYRRTLQEGLNAIAAAKNKSIEEVVRDEKASNLTPTTWVDEKVSKVTVDDMLNVQRNRMTANDRKEDERKWRRLNGLLLKAEEWDAALLVAREKGSKMDTFEDKSGRKVRILEV